MARAVPECKVIKSNQKMPVAPIDDSDKIFDRAIRLKFEQG